MRNIIKLAAPLLIVATACGSDGSDTPHRPSVSETAKASDVSAADATSLCKYINALEPHASKQQNCNVGAALYTQDKASCQQAVTACKKQPEDKSDDEPVDCSTAAAELKGCSATVAELEQCFEELRAQFQAAFENTTCDDAGHITEEQLFGAPSSCTKIEQKCPQLMMQGDDVSDDGQASEN